MSDPTDELADRFETHSPEADDDTGGMDQTDGTDNTDDMETTEETRRDKQQVAMYLPEDKVEQWDSLYDRLDARSKLNNRGGIEKNSDFAEAVVELAEDYEEELADRLDTGSI